MGLVLLAVACGEGDQRHGGDAAQAERAGLGPGLSTVPQVDALAVVHVGAGQQLQPLTQLVGLQADDTLGGFGSHPHHAGGTLWPRRLALTLVALHVSCKKWDTCYHNEQDAGDRADQQNQTMVEEV